VNGASKVYVGAARAGSGEGGLFRKSAGDTAWHRLEGGLPADTQVQAITVHPADRDIVYAGTHRGPYRSRDRGDTWERLDFPDDGTQVWAIAVHPGDANVLYAGTSPVGVFRSDDGGDSWRRLPVPALPEHVRMEFPCRVMRLAVDPSNPEHVYATLEVGGVIRSLDGGQTWDDCSTDLIALAERPHLKSKLQSDTEIEGMMDGHALCVSATSPGTVFLAVRMGLFRSDDKASTWRDMEVGRFSPLTYARDVRVSPQDPRTLYVCLSPAARSEDGSLYRSDDLGGTWSRADSGVKADATMMAVALHPDDPDEVHCVSRCGQVFSTLDGGKNWQESRLPDSIRDIYAVACH
jgi:photosystem II stability/assembly factor-like uncharacterized protein